MASLYFLRFAHGRVVKIEDEKGHTTIYTGNNDAFKTYRMCLPDLVGTAWAAYMRFIQFKLAIVDLQLHRFWPAMGNQALVSDM